MILSLLLTPLLLICVIFTAIGVAALYRFPDVYTRIQGASKCTIFGVLSAILALLLYAFVCFISSTGESRSLTFFLRFLLAGILLIALKPISTHIIASVAFRSGIEPVTNKKEDSD